MILLNLIIHNKSKKVFNSYEIRDSLIPFIQLCKNPVLFENRALNAVIL
jgi:hypothetical protein